MLLGIKDEDVVDDALLTVALAATEYDQVLTKLSGAVAVARRGRLAHGL